MSNTTTKKMLRLFEKKATPTMFLTGMFQAPPDNFYNSETIEYDVLRFKEDVSIVVQDIDVGGRLNKAEVYTNKEFKAPVHKEQGVIRASSLYKREPGVNPFADFNFQTKATNKALMLLTQMQDKIKRATELQASQVLQTGELSLINETGSVLYSINYAPKASHFPTAAITWGAAGYTPIADLDSLARTIRSDALAKPDQIIFGADAWEKFIADDEVKARLDNRRMELGVISAPEVRGEGGTYNGSITIGDKRFDLWTYDGQYENIQTSAKTTYIEPGKVVVKTAASRLDATFGGFPTFANPVSDLLPALPRRLSSGNNISDISIAAWLSNDKQSLIMQANSRPLLIPTDIDSFGCLDTGL